MSLTAYAAGFSLGCMADKKRSSKRDFSEIAASIVAQAVGEEEKAEPPKIKDPLAVELGRRGGLKGGKARAAKLTPEQRTEIARTAAKARWHK